MCGERKPTEAAEPSTNNGRPSEPEDDESALPGPSEPTRASPQQSQGALPGTASAEAQSEGRELRWGTVNDSATEGGWQPAARRKHKAQGKKGPAAEPAPTAYQASKAANSVAVSSQGGGKQGPEPHSRAGKTGGKSVSSHGEQREKVGARASPVAEKPIKADRAGADTAAQPSPSEQKSPDKASEQNEAVLTERREPDASALSQQSEQELEQILGIRVPEVRPVKQTASSPAATQQLPPPPPAVERPRPGPLRKPPPAVFRPSGLARLSSVFSGRTSVDVIPFGVLSSDGSQG